MAIKSFEDITDQELLNRFRHQQNNEWLGVLFERYTMLLFGVCMKYLKDEHEARDAVQQVFLKALTELQKYEVSYFKSWVYMIAKNHCLMQLRGKLQKTELHEHTLSSESEIPVEEILEHEWQLNLMESVIPLLNPEQQRCIKLFYLEKKSYQQICAETGFSMLQVKSHIQNGKRNLRILMERKMKRPS